MRARNAACQPDYIAVMFARKGAAGLAICSRVRLIAAPRLTPHTAPHTSALPSKAVAKRQRRPRPRLAKNGNDGDPISPHKILEQRE